MSSILLEDSSTTPLFETQDANGGLKIVGQTDQTNIFTVGESGFNDPPVGGEDTIVGGNLADVMNGGLQDDIIIGQGGDDVLEGEEGKDILIGGTGDDILRGGTGSDIMTGGEGNDIFEFFVGDSAAGEVDIITDFDDDLIVLKGIGSGANVSYNKETGIVSVDGNDVIKLDDNPDISIENSDNDPDWELF